eukprot:CAMPEP_0202878546 /NCGR_PEP_ID=MMETSP1391-20130828/32338_1 /ASSEMBLY_ACC=CAM_ASM_000867 /TAXON_ID=1034604 /ORGANISM="Chlamydomonas leiostraca, Strain SAG 11-49" /LENGTH=181 /DNA_ID=CAMNT_0049560745 /DNA_START=72 /DNA_END=613 /DNA_ORIENTATION=+
MSDASKAGAPPKEAWQLAWATTLPAITALRTRPVPEITPATTEDQQGPGSTSAPTAQDTLNHSMGFEAATSAVQGGASTVTQALPASHGDTQPQPQPRTSTLTAAQAAPGLRQLLQQDPWELRVLRCGALDAGRLDGEVGAMVGEQAARAAVLLPAGHVSSIQPELNALLRLVLYGIPLWR